MTREEAMAILEVSKHMATSGRMYDQAIDMAIEALNYQNLSEPNNTCEVDLISRADAIEAVRLESAKRGSLGRGDILNVLSALPSAEQVASKFNNPCNSLLTDESNGSKEHKSKLDLISRADAINTLETEKRCTDREEDVSGLTLAKLLISALPSAELPKGDLISRKVLMDRLESFCKWCKDGRLQGAEFVWDCIVPNVPSADAIHSVGVFVPNMEMPKACDYCLFHDSEWSWCKAKDKYCGDGKCPLIAVRGERND